MEVDFSTVQQTDNVTANASDAKPFEQSEGRGRSNSNASSSFMMKGNNQLTNRLAAHNTTSPLDTV